MIVLMARLHIFVFRSRSYSRLGSSALMSFTIFPPFSLPPFFSASFPLPPLLPPALPGHVRVGATLITDPAYLVTRNMEDFITWTHTSAIRKHVMQYNELRDDFDTM